MCLRALKIASRAGFELTSVTVQSELQVLAAAVVEPRLEIVLVLQLGPAARRPDCKRSRCTLFIGASLCGSRLRRIPLPGKSSFLAGDAMLR